jgi:membrane protease YdiL (CAAX protease family)
MNMNSNKKLLRILIHFYVSICIFSTLFITIITIYFSIILNYNLILNYAYLFVIVVILYPIIVILLDKSGKLKYLARNIRSKYAYKTKRDLSITKYQVLIFLSYLTVVFILFLIDILVFNSSLDKVVKDSLKLSYSNFQNVESDFYEVRMKLVIAYSISVSIWISYISSENFRNF